MTQTAPVAPDTGARKPAYGTIDADNTTGRALWEAACRFSASWHQSHNLIAAEFEIHNAGPITRQRNRFDLWRWLCQGRGISGAEPGWRPFFRRMFGAQTAANLETYLANRKKSHDPMTRSGTTRQEACKWLLI